MSRYHHTGARGAVIREGDDLLEECQWHREHEASHALVRSEDGAILYLRTTSAAGKAERQRRLDVLMRRGKL